jgi:uroporphyrin-III C-methyltransferase/precorrin-2 dehydrogenase/sirohydrochlorin ferrochelatase
MTSMLDTNRSPSESAPPRMDKLARLPVFFSLHGKRVLIAGGNAGAAWKTELLAAAGAYVDVYTNDPSPELIGVASKPPSGEVTLHRKPWDPVAMAGCTLAIGACETDEEARAFQAAAHTAGIPCNVIDNPDYCDFSFGAIVNRSPLVVAISTDGAAPVFAQAIRSRIEAMLPTGFARWAEAARNWRNAVKQSGLSFNGRRLFWQTFTRAALHDPNGEPSGADFEALLQETKAQAPTAEHGSVTLVGAGPGDPELLTLRAVRALQSADVILYDDLVSKEVLDFARREAKRMLVGKTGHGPSCKQSEINALMVGLARSGRRVVRLKGGDPMIFGRAGEEIAACSAARRVQYLTGHGENGLLPEDIDWRSVADPNVTSVIYMPKKTLRQFVDRSLAVGLDPATPALAISNATRPDEQVVAARISELADTALPNGPTIVMVGSVCAGVSSSRHALCPHVLAPGSTRGAAR